MHVDAPSKQLSGHRIGRIVVGVDGSPPAMRALGWAAEEAALRGAELEVVHADFCRQEALEALAPGLLETEQSVVDAAVTAARKLAPRIVVTGRIVDPPAARALTVASEGADMLVVGSRGHGGLKSLALGSVSNECVHHARCPVVVIPPEDPSRPSGLDTEPTHRHLDPAGPPVGVE
jgi:nucleotide-binding universal stress UspA family protein